MNCMLLKLKRNELLVCLKARLDGRLRFIHSLTRIQPLQTFPEVYQRVCSLSSYKNKGLIMTEFCLIIDSNPAKDFEVQNLDLPDEKCLLQ